MSISTRLHFQVLQHEFEAVCLLSALALLADFGWVIHDIYANGISIVYTGIAVSLFLALIGTCCICYRHHIYYFQQLRSKTMIDRLYLNKRIHRSKKS